MKKIKPLLWTGAFSDENDYSLFCIGNLFGAIHFSNTKTFFKITQRDGDKACNTRNISIFDKKRNQDVAI